jgi:hypothetical protein
MEEPSRIPKDADIDSDNLMTICVVCQRPVLTSLTKETGKGRVCACCSQGECPPEENDETDTADAA